MSVRYCHHWMFSERKTLDLLPRPKHWVSFNLRNFHGIYRFLPVLTEILEKIHFFLFYSAFYAPIGVKNIVFKYESNFMQQFGKSVCRILRKFGNYLLNSR